MLNPKMAELKRDLIKIENSKTIRQSSRPQKRIIRQQKEMMHSPSKQNSNCSDENMLSNRSPIPF